MSDETDIRDGVMLWMRGEGSSVEVKGREGQGVTHSGKEHHKTQRHVNLSVHIKADKFAKCLTIALKDIWRSHRGQETVCG